MCIRGRTFCREVTVGGVAKVWPSKKSRAVVDDRRDSPFEREPIVVKGNSFEVRNYTVPLSGVVMMTADREECSRNTARRIHELL
jgi:hypothetical protein